MKRRAHSSSGAGPTAAKVKKDVPLVRRAGPYLLGEKDTSTSTAQIAKNTVPLYAVLARSYLELNLRWFDYRRQL